MTARRALLAALLTACAAAPVPQPPELGQRVRVRIASRGSVPSITTAPYRVLLQVRKPDGRLDHFGVYAPEFAESESIGGELAVKIANVHGLADFAFVESLLAGDATLVHDFVLPNGWSLDFTPGHFYAYRRVDGDRLVADLAPEIRIGQITADGSRYVELQPTAGPDLAAADGDPPGWPPKD